jgi:hypothetical protein
MTLIIYRSDYCELGEFENGIIYHNKALAVIDNVPEEFQSKHFK